MLQYAYRANAVPYRADELQAGTTFTIWRAYSRHTSRYTSNLVKT